MKTKSKRGRKKVHPWSQWFRRDYFVLIPGKDFTGRSYTMAQQLRNHAGQFGVTELKVDIADDGTLTVTVEARSNHA